MRIHSLSINVLILVSLLLLVTACSDDSSPSGLDDITPTDGDGDDDDDTADDDDDTIDDDDDTTDDDDDTIDDDDDTTDDDDDTTDDDDDTTDDDDDTTQEPAIIEGTISYSGGAQGSAIILAIFSSWPSEQPVDSVTLTEEQVDTMISFPFDYEWEVDYEGSAYLVALLDVNENGEPDDGEPVAYTDPAITLTRSESTNVDLTLMELELDGDFDEIEDADDEEVEDADGDADESDEDGDVDDEEADTEEDGEAENMAPILDLDGTLDDPEGDIDYDTDYVEDGPFAPIVESDELTLEDPEGDDIASVTITIFNLQDGQDEVLEIDTLDTGITADYDGINGIMTLTGPDTAENFQKVLRTIVYYNLSDTPSVEERVIVFVANDGMDDSEEAQTVLRVTAANDPPTVSDVADQEITEDTASDPIPFTIDDPDTQIENLTVTALSDNQDLVADEGLVIAGEGAERTLTITPILDATGPVTITIEVFDGEATGTDTFVLTIDAVNDPPTISDIPDQQTDEDTEIGPIDFVIGDSDVEADALVVQAFSGDQDLVQDSDITLSGSGENRAITISPVPNAFGIVTITVSVSDEVSKVIVSDTFDLTIVSINDAPTISDITDQSTDEDIVAGAYIFSISDVETAPESLVLTAVSDNQDIVADIDIVLGGTGVNRNIILTPIPNANGAVTITITVSDGELEAMDEFELSVNAVNDAPTVSDIDDVEIEEDIPTDPIAFTVGDVETDLDALNITVTSDNQQVVEDSAIVLSGSGADRTLVITPVANAFGIAVITVTVNDGELETFTTFDVTVTAVNDAPTLSAFEDQSTPEDTPTDPIPFTIGDVETNPDSLIVTASSSDQLIIEDAGILLDGTGTDRTLTIAPLLNAFGVVTITVSVDDGDAITEETFDIEVTAVNDQPTISQINDRGTAEDVATPPIPFTIGDVETDPDSLIVTAASSNQNVVADSGITLGGTGAARTIVLDPVANAQGETTITITVSDGELQVQEPFLLTVYPESDPPTISDIADQNIDEDQSTGPLAFVVDDPDGVETLTVRAESSNPLIVNEAGMELLGTGTNRTIEVTPLPNANGTVTIEVFVSDGPNTFSDTFDVIIAPVNDPPTADDKNVATNEDTSRNITLTGVDVDLEPFDFVIVKQPDHGTLDTSALPLVVYMPELNYFGPDDFRYVTRDAAPSDSAEATVTITVNPVNDPPTITEIADLQTDEDTPTAPLAFTIDDVETAPDSLTVSARSSNQSVVANAGLVLTGSGADRFITVNPVLNASGFSTITITVSDEEFDVIEAFEIEVVAVNDRPIANDQNVETDEDSPVSITLTGSDVETIPPTFEIVDNPTSGNLVGVAPNLIYEPHPDYNGPDQFTFRTFDGDLYSVTATVSIVVHPVNDAPTISNIGNQNTPEDTPLGPIGFTVDDIDNPVSGLIVTAVSDNQSIIADAGLVIGGSDSNRTITINPVPNMFGTVTITVTVSDGDLTDFDTFTVQVTSVNDPPVGDDQILSTDEDTPLSITLTGSDIENSPLQFFIVDHPTYGLLSGTPPNVVYTPNPDYNTPHDGGPDTFTFTVYDGEDNSVSVATVTITVDPVNDPPIADDQAVEVDEDVPTTITLTGSDIDDDPLTFSIINQPDHGTLDDSALPDVIYTSDLNYNGPDAFTFTVNDGTVDADSDGTVNIDVLPVNDPPTGVDDSYSDIIGNTMFEVIDPENGILDNDSDLEGDGIAAQEVTWDTTDEGGNITIYSDGTFEYSPPPGFVGNDTYTYTLVDDGTPPESSTAQITFQIASMIWYVQNDYVGPPAGDGRSTTPFDNLLAVEGVSSEGDVIYIREGDGTTFNQDAGIVLKDGQILLGSGVDLEINGDTLELATGAPIISNIAGGPGGKSKDLPEGHCVTLADNNFISGLNIVGSMGGGIFGHNISGELAIVDCAIADNGLPGLSILIDDGESQTQVAIVDSPFDNNNGGIAINGNNADLYVESSNITGVSGTALDITNMQGNLTLNNSSIVINGGQPINFNNTNGDFDLSINGSSIIANSFGGPLFGAHMNNCHGAYTFGPTSIESTVDTAFAAMSTDGTITFAGAAASFTDAGDRGIQLVDFSGVFNAGGTVTGSMNQAIEINGGDGNVQFTNTTISQSGDRVIEVVGTTGGFVAFTGGTIANNNGTGVLVADAVGGVSLTNGTITNSTSSGISVVNSTGTYSFSAMTLTNAAGIAFNIDGGTPTVTYDGNITNGADFLISMMNTTGGSALFRNGTLVDTNGKGIWVESAGNLTINSSTTITNSSTTGISVVDCSGTYSFPSMAIANSTGVAFNIFGGSPDIAYTGSIDNDEHYLIRGSGMTGGFAAFASGPFVDVGGNGIYIDNSTFDLDVNNVTIDGSTGMAISMVNATGPYVFNGATIVDPVDIAFNVSEGAPVITYDGNITNSSERIVQVTDTTGGEASFQNGLLSDTNGGGIGVMNSVFNLTVDNASIVDSVGDGVHIGDSTGTFILDDMNISQAAGVALNVFGGAATTSYIGDIFNSSDYMVRVVDTTATVDVVGPPSPAKGRMIDDGGAGILISNATANVSITNAGISNSVGTGVSVLGSSASFTFSAIDITGATGIAFNVSGGNPVITYDGSIVNHTDRLLAIQNTASGSATFTGNMLDETGTGVLMNNATFDFVTMENVTITDSIADGIALNAVTGNVTVNTAAITGCAMGGIDIADSAGTYNFTSTNITDAAGVAFNLFGGDSVVTYNGAIVNHADRLLAIQNTNSGNATFTGSMNDETGTGILINGSTLDFVTVENVTITNSGADGIVINAVTGNVTVNTATITGCAQGGIDIVDSAGTYDFNTMSLANAAGIAFNIDGETAEVTYDGTISNFLDYVLRVANTTGGNASFIGGMTDDGGNGILVNSAISNVLVSGAQLDNSAVEGINIVNSTGAYEFNGVDINFPANDAFRIFGGEATISLDGAIFNNQQYILHVANTISGGAMFSGGMYDDGGNGILIDTAASDVVLDSAQLDNSAIEGINIVDSTGSYDFTGMGIDSASNTAFRVSGGDASIYYDGSISNYSDYMIYVGNFGGEAEFVSGTFYDENSDGIYLSSVTGDVYISNAELLGSTGHAIDIRECSGYVGLDIFTIMVSGTNGINVFNSSADIEMYGMNVDSTGGAGLSVEGLTMDDSPYVGFDGSIVSTIGPAIGVTGGSPFIEYYGDIFNDSDYMVHATNIFGGYIDVMGYSPEKAPGPGSGMLLDSGAQGILLSNVSADVDIRNFGLSNSIDTGISIIDGSGYYGFNNGSISNAAGVAFSVTGSNADIYYRGMIENSADRMIYAFNTGGMIEFAGEEVKAGRVFNDGAGGIYLQNTMGPVYISSASLMHDGLYSSNAGGELFIADSDFIGNTGDAIRVENHSDSLLVGGCTIDSPVSDGIIVSSGTGMVDIIETSITAAGFNGMTFDSLSGGISVSNSFVLGSVGEGIRIINGTNSFDFRGVDMDGNTGVAFHVANGDPVVTVNPEGGSIQNSSDLLLLVEGTTGGAVMATGMTDDGGLGILVSNAAGNVTVNNSVVGNSLAFGINIMGGSGLFDFNQMLILGPIANAINIDGGNATVTFDGDIVNMSNRLIAVQNTGVEASAVITGLGGLNDNGGMGILISNAAGAVTVNNASIANSSVTGVDVVSSSGIFTFTSVNITDATGNAFNIVGGNPAITYDGNIGNTTNRLIAVANTTGGSAIFQNGTLSDNGGTGIYVVDAAGNLTVNNATIANSTLSGIEVVGSTGIYDFNDMNINGAALAAFNLFGGTSTITYDGDINNTSDRLIAIVSTTGGSADFTGITGLNDSGTGLATGTGIYVQDAIINLTVGNATITNSDANGIEIQNSSGTYAFTGMDITDAAGNGFHIAGNKPIVTYDGNMKNSTNRLIEVVNTSGGSATFQNGALSDNGAMGIYVHDAASSLSVDNARIANSTVTGIEVENSTGTYAFTTMDIENATGNGFHVNGNTPTVTYDGDMNNSLNHLIAVVNTTGGSAAFTGTTGLADNAGTGILIDNASNAKVTVANATLTDSTSTGLEISNSSGQFDFESVSIANSVSTAFSLQGGTDVNVLFNSVGTGNISKNNAGYVVDINGVGGASSASFDNGVVSGDGPANSGVRINNSMINVDMASLQLGQIASLNIDPAVDISNSNGAFSFDNMEIDNTGGVGMYTADATGTLGVLTGSLDTSGNGFHFNLSGRRLEVNLGDSESAPLAINSQLDGVFSEVYNAADLTVGLDNCTLVSGDEGIEGSSFNDSILNVSMRNSALASSGGNGIELASSNASTLDARLENNTISNSSANGVKLSANESSILNADILEGNTIQNSTLNGVDLEAVINAGLIVNITDSNTIDLSGGNGVDAYANGMGDPAQLDLTIVTSNLIDHSTGRGVLVNLDGSAEGIVEIDDTNTISNSVVNGIEMNTQANSNLNAIITNNSITDTTIGDGIKFASNGFSTMNLVVLGNTVDASGNNGFAIDAYSDSNVTANTSYNTITNSGNDGISVVALADTVVSDLFMEGNTITNSGWDGIFVNAREGSSICTTVYENIIDTTVNVGMYLTAIDSGHISADVQFNEISLTGLWNYYLQADQNLSSFCANFTSNVGSGFSVFEKWYIAPGIEADFDIIGVGQIYANNPGIPAPYWDWQPGIGQFDNVASCPSCEGGELPPGPGDGF